MNLWSFFFLGYSFFTAPFFLGFWWFIVGFRVDFIGDQLFLEQIRHKQREIGFIHKRLYAIF